MPTIDISRSHGLSMPESHERIEKVGQKLAAKYGLSGGWTGENRYDFKRTGVKGHVLLREGEVSVRVELSMLLGALRGKVEQKLKKSLAEEFG
ncbi:MAG TPA: polyhydroxyalkanoic acid system family protein [Myxococcota bacterium]|nr:polyhydroxyalkanoic acid system family protein [Myxococcota bacterium]